MKAVVLACIVLGATIAGPAVAGDRSTIGGSVRADQPLSNEPFASPDAKGGERGGPTTASLAMREALARAACRDRFGAEVSCSAAADERRYGGALKGGAKNRQR